MKAGPYGARKETAPSRMKGISGGVITLDDALSFLSSRSCTPSTMGAQLDALRDRAEADGQSLNYDGIHVRSQRQDAVKVAKESENRLLRDIGVIRCVDALARVQHDRIMKNKPSLTKLQRLVADRCEGELVVQCLRAYEARRLHSPEAALAAVYQWAHAHAPDSYPAVLHSETDLPQAFRLGKASRARQKAADLYADCYLVLAEFVAAWNRRQIRAA